jgi:hypothetical protein
LDVDKIRLKVVVANENIPAQGPLSHQITMRTVIKIQFVTIVLSLFLISAPLFAQQPFHSNSALSSGKRVLVISIDGMRSDVLLRAKAPNIRELMRHGSFTFWAESTDIAITLPTHVSMLTGVSPAKHHITWNDDKRVESSAFTVPTLFELAKKAGYDRAPGVGPAGTNTGDSDCRPRWFRSISRRDGAIHSNRSGGKFTRRGREMVCCGKIGRILLGSSRTSEPVPL